jgi:hypothetical protein
MSAEPVYRAERCPCGFPGCRSGNVRPLTYGQGVMQMEEAQDVAQRLNAYPKLVAALVAIRDLTHTGTARDDFTVRHETFQIAQRELVALGHTPYEWEAP